MSRQPDRSHADAADRGIAAIKDLALLGAAAAVVCAGLAFWFWRSAPNPVESTSRVRRDDGRGESMFVGNAVCRECHPGESAAHARSGHSRTLRRAADHPLARGLDGKTVRDKEFDALWEYAFRDGELTVSRTEQGTTTRMVIDYAFGSGQHGTTFVSLTDRTPSHPAGLEHRLSYFSDTQDLDTTPGQSKKDMAEPKQLTPSGRVLGAEKTLQCFGCHSTLLSSTALDEIDTASMVANISCERCHGPARNHVEAARRNATNLKMPFGPDSSDADKQMRFCGFCHRHPETSPAESIRPDNPTLARFQPVGLMQSKCYSRTSGGLACTVCHDPHSRASASRERYETACLDCHNARPQTVCPVSPAKGCISCHMPTRDLGHGALFHDHWIRIHKTPERSVPAPRDPALRPSATHSG